MITTDSLIDFCNRFLSLPGMSDNLAGLLRLKAAPCASLTSTRMTSSAEPQTQRTFSLMMKWIIAVAGLYVGVVWFSRQSLQTESEINRRDLWLAIPDLLSEYVNPSEDHARQLPPSGWAYLPERLAPMGIAAVILVFAWGWGSLAIRYLIGRHISLDRLEHYYWSLCLGLAIWGTLTLLLGVCGALSFPIFTGAGAIPLAISIWQKWVRRNTSNTTSPPAELATHRRETGLAITCLLMVSPFLLAMLLGSLQPPNDFDVKEYHLGGAKEFFLRGRVEMLPHDVYTSFPFLTEMLCLSGMVLKRDWFTGALAGQAVLAAFAPITALGIFIAARRWSTSTAAWFAVLTHLSCPWIYRISIIAYAEGGLACFLFATFFATVRAIESRDPPATHRWALLAGILAGASAGCKYPAALTVVIPLGLMLLTGKRFGTPPASREPIAPMTTSPVMSRGKMLLRLTVLYALGVLTTFGPWLAKNLCETGNPVYPLLYSIFGGKDWDAASDAKWNAGHALPLRQISGIGWIVRDTRDRLWDIFLGSDWQSALYLSLAVALIFSFWKRSSLPTSKEPGRTALKLAVLYSLWLFLSWQYFTHRIDRFWVPMLPMLSLLAGAALSWLWEEVERFMPHRTREVYWVLRGLFLLPIAGVVVFNLAVATSSLGGNNSYLMRMQDLRDLTKTHCVAYVESLSLSPSDKVLFVGEAELFDAHFLYEYNTVFDHSIFERDCRAVDADGGQGDPRLRPINEIREAWKSRGITHIVVNWSEILRYRTTYGFTDFVHPQRFQELVAAGLLAPEGQPQVALLERLSTEKQSEILRWAPQLILPETASQRSVIVFQAFHVQ